jgi:DNA-directed RNA polymerase subunit M/transcription elongation factor TFIIS
MSHENDDSMIIDPEGDEGKKRRRKVQEEQQQEQQAEEKQKEAIDAAHYEAKNREGKVQIRFSTQGRFSTPEAGYFGNYTVKHMNDITLARRDEILETLVAILNELVDHTEPGWEDFEVEDMLMEEFFELQVGLKFAFYGKKHKHFWMHSCQEDVEDEDKKPSEQIIDLDTLTHIAIEEAEKELRELYSDTFHEMTDKEFENYLEVKYPGQDHSDKTRDSEIAAFQVKDRIIVKAPGKVYEFRFTRIRDVLAGKRIADQEFSGKLMRARKQKWDQKTPLEQWKSEQNYKVEQIEHKKAKAMVLYGRALSLVSVNGKSLSDSEKIHEFSNMDAVTSQQFIQFHNTVKIGIQDEREYTCNLCGKQERGWLQRRSNPIEFLPIDSDTSRELGNTPAANVFFGI